MDKDKFIQNPYEKIKPSKGKDMDKDKFIQTQYEKIKPSKRKETIK